MLYFKISLWDLRANKVVSTYFDNIESNLKCSIKIGPAGTYLYNSKIDLLFLFRNSGSLNQFSEEPMLCEKLSLNIKNKDY